jgi:16S rRNA processing protein RimM
MKFLGTIIEAKNDGTLLLIDFPEGLKSVKPNSNIKIGFNLNFSNSFTCSNGKPNRKRFEIKIKEHIEHSFALKLIEQGVFIDETSMVFNQEEGYFVSDLIDSRVHNFETHEYIGKITDVYVLPANDVWIIETDNGELPIPVINDVVKKVDIEKKLIEIVLIDGLMDLLSTKNDESYEN